MLKVNGQRFYAVVSMIAKMTAVAENIPHDQSAHAKFSTVPKAFGMLGGLVTMLNDLKNELATLGTPMTGMSVDRAIRTCSGNPTGLEIIEAFKNIESRIGDELSLIYLFVIDKKYAAFLDEKANPFGDAVAAKFPSSSYEITEAGKCLALRRSTACVAHLMRALEPALNGLATALNVPFAHSNWQNILDQIEKEIKKRAAAPHAATWKDDEQFYSEAAVHFRILKDAWRNHTMHLRDRYDEERAETIFQSVRGFMQHLAIRLSEPLPSV